MPDHLVDILELDIVVDIVGLCDSILYKVYLSRLVGKPTMWFPNRSDTNRPVQAQKRARSLKFRILVEEELYFPSSENKGADRLRNYCEADLHLCFSIGRLLVFRYGGSFLENIYVTSLLKKTLLLLDWKVVSYIVDVHAFSFILYRVRFCKMT